MILRLLALLVVSLSASAVPFFDQAIEWREEVSLRSGESLLVERSVTYGPDEWFRPGRGPITGQTLSFPWKGRTVKWTPPRALSSALPVVLDQLDGAPLVVVPVYGSKACSEYDFPQEGFAAWREERGRWVRVDAARVPPDLRINLLRSVADLRREPPAKGTVVNEEWRRRVVEGFPKNMQGDALRSVQLGEVAHSCRTLRPPPNPEQDERLRRTAAAEHRAGTLLAERISWSEQPETVSRKDADANRGFWSDGGGWVAPACTGIVERVEPIHGQVAAANSMPGALGGYRIHLASAGSQAPIVLPGNQPQLVRVDCDGAAIFAIRAGGSGDRLLVNRFDRSGKFRDATMVQFPGAAEIPLDPKSWPTLWNVAIAGTNLDFTLVDYAQSLPMSQGGTLRRKAVYRVRLPD